MVARGTQGLFRNSVSDCWVRTSMTSARPLDRVFHTRVATRRDCKKQGGTHHQHQHSECSAHLHYPGRYRGSEKLVVEVVGSVKVHCRSGGTFERERGVDPPWSGRSASCAILRLDLYILVTVHVLRQWRVLRAADVAASGVPYMQHKRRRPSSCGAVRLPAHWQTFGVFPSQSCDLRLVLSTCVPAGLHHRRL